MSFDTRTPERVAQLIAGLSRDTRIRVHYGDAETGQDWGDLYDVAGYIGRTTGDQSPILLNNRRSMGGGMLLDHCIVRVRYANRRDGGDLYLHPTYTPPAREDWIGGMGTEAEYAKHFPPVGIRIGL
jgi:hypothetical protein